MKIKDELKKTQDELQMTQDKNLSKKGETASMGRNISSSLKQEERDLLFDNRILENLMDVETVSKICGVTPKTIHNWVYLKSIPYLKVGRKVMFKKRSILSWLNQKEIKLWQ